MLESPLYLLSPYRPPTSYPITLNDGEAAAWLTGYAALWHPALIKHATRPVDLASSYDHDDPTPNAIYVIPAGPTLYQPSDWAERLAEVNAKSIVATADRTETVSLLLKAIDASPVTEACHRMFAAVGLAYLTIETWFDAASHEHLLDQAAFWADVKTAAETPDDLSHVRTHLKSACEKLQYAREILHSGNLRLLDIVELKSIHALSHTPHPFPKGRGEQEETGQQDELQNWPPTLAAGMPITVLGSVESYEQLKTRQPDCFTELMAKCPPDLPAQVEFATGAIRERDEQLLSVESQLFNLSRSRERLKTLTGHEPSLYGRNHAANHLQLPSWLSHVGIKHALTQPITGEGGSTTKSPCLQWPGPDGKTIEAFSKDYLAAHDPQVFFNLAYHLHTASSHEATPAFAFLHQGIPACESHRDLVAFADLSTALGEWQGVSQYLTEVGSGDYSGVASPDDFTQDILDDRVSKRQLARPVSAVAGALRIRRRIDAAFGLAALHRMLSNSPPQPLGEGGESSSRVKVLPSSLSPHPKEEGNKTRDEEQDLNQLNETETHFETAQPDGDIALDLLTAIEQSIAARLATRIQLRSEANRPGYLLLNPCNYTRRLALELPPFANPIAIDGPIKAAQFDKDKTRLVVEVPSLGFTWIPNRGPSATPPKSKIVTASESTVRNEFFEAEFDAATGGIRAFRDLKTRSNRMGLIPVFNPGCKTRGTSLKIVHAGNALGEIISTGELVNEVDEPLATFELTARAWIGRPVLEVKCTWTLSHQPNGFPWHAYYGLRFGVRDDRIAVYRGINGTSYPCHTSRIVSPDFFEFRFGRERSFIYPGGVPFLSKVTPRTYDWINIAQGETQRTFECLLSLDRDNPMQTAAGWVSPTVCIPTDKGPPPTGQSSWLAHVDMPSVIVTDFRPASDGQRAILMRLLETTNFAGSTNIQFARDPARAFSIDGMSQTNHQIDLAENAVPIDFSAGELFRIRAEWD